MNNNITDFEKSKQLLTQFNLNIVEENLSKPWGGYYVIDETQAALFAQHFFPEEDFDTIKITEKLSPKILIIAPGKRLSWQYHHRRAEIWRCIKGKVAVSTSLTNINEKQQILNIGDKIKIQQGERHRLIGLDDWGIIAEIWQHTDLENPSNEEDIIRLQDDFGR